MSTFIRIKANLHISIVFVLLLSSLEIFAQQNHGENAKLFFEANKELNEGQLEKAIDNYNSIIESGFIDSQVYYNLGIALYRDNQLGKSIFYFKKAREITPRDADIRFNLQFAKKKSVDKIEDKSNPIAAYILSLFPLNMREGLYLFLFISFLLCASSTMILFYRNDWIIWCQRLSLLLFLFVSIELAGKWVDMKPFGVITSKEASVYSGMGTHNVLLFSLHEGTEFQITDKHGQDWIRIELKDGKKGWLLSRSAIF